MMNLLFNHCDFYLFFIFYIPYANGVNDFFLLFIIWES